MLRSLAMLVVVVAGCSGPATPPAAPARAQTPPEPASSDSHSASGSFRSIVEPNDKLVVLIFDGEQNRAAALARAWRQYLRSFGIQVSDQERSAIDEMLLAGCHADVTGDGMCIANIARQLGTEWILWGALEGDVLKLQLVHADPVSERHGSFIASMARAPIEVAWRQLSELLP